MKGLIAVIVLIVLGGGYYWYTQNQASTGTESASDDFGMTVDQSNTDAMDNTGTNTSGNTSDSAGTNVNVDVDVGATVTTGTKEFTVTNAGMTFTQKTLAVNKGDRVKITFQNTGGTHDFRVDGYNVGTKVISNGQSETFEFVADKAGSFEYYCSVGQHRQLGMKGTLTVK